MLSSNMLLPNLILLIDVTSSTPTPDFARWRAFVVMNAEINVRDSIFRCYFRVTSISRNEDIHSIFVAHFWSNSASDPFDRRRLAIVLGVPGDLAQALGCDCAPRSRVLPLLVSGLVLRGAVVGIS